MDLTKLKCCAITEIAQLSAHKTPRAAMIDFCKKKLLLGGTTLYHPGSFVLFSGVIDIEKGSNDYLVQTGLTKVDYGPKFAAYITKNKLGEVVDIPEQKNQNHKTHTVKVWIWLPNFEALKVWWSKVKQPKSRKASFR